MAGAGTAPGMDEAAMPAPSSPTKPTAPAPREKSPDRRKKCGCRSKNVLRLENSLMKRPYVGGEKYCLRASPMLCMSMGCGPCCCRVLITTATASSVSSVKPMTRSGPGAAAACGGDGRCCCCWWRDGAGLRATAPEPRPKSPCIANKAECRFRNDLRLPTSLTKAWYFLCPSCFCSASPTTFISTGRGAWGWRMATSSAIASSSDSDSSLDGDLGPGAATAGCAIACVGGGSVCF
mmetsp:Transcript_25873/g.56061  ORF Transcript_25873/g.56061 Transcript_25873/m.56061 type:complete len:236 (+) Transcript_25873:253-960(+)